MSAGRLKMSALPHEHFRASVHMIVGTSSGMLYRVCSRISHASPLSSLRRATHNKELQSVLRKAPRPDLQAMSCGPKPSLEESSSRLWKGIQKEAQRHRPRNRQEEQRQGEIGNAPVLFGQGIPQCADPFGIHVDHPFTIVDALTLDHIDGGGRKHMIQLFGYATGGRPFYRHLKREGWPPGYRVLCMNCQWIARRRGNHAA